MYAGIYIHMYVLTYVCNVCIVCTYVCTYVHMYICTYTCMYLRTCLSACQMKQSSFYHCHCHMLVSRYKLTLKMIYRVDIDMQLPSTHSG